MIKFFRNFRKKLLNEGKTSRYLTYAIGEIILVVIGILIALQINNWNEHRKDRLKEKVLLESIHKEFLKNRRQLDTVLAYHRIVMKSSQELISQFPIDVTKADFNTISQNLRDILYTFTFNPSQGSINNLINTGSFNIINDETLREALISWPDIVIDFQEEELNAWRVVNEHLDPLFAKNFNFDFDPNDPRNNYHVLETLEFEYYLQLRIEYLKDLFEIGEELKVLETHLDLIIEHSKNSET